MLQRVLRFALILALAGSAQPPTSFASACAGDCDEDAIVGVNELITAVNIALGTAPIDRCGGIDVDLDSNVSVSELVRAVGYALNGCASPLTRSGLSSLFLAIDAVRALDAINPALSVGRIESSPYRCRSLADARTEPAPPPPPTGVCFGFGSATSICEVGDVVSRFGTVFENCRSYDPFTDNNLFRNGIVQTVVMDLGNCDPSLTATVRQYTADFLDLVTDPFNRTVERIEQKDLQWSFDDTAEGCALPSLTQGMGRIEVERPCLGEARSYVYESFERTCIDPAVSFRGSLVVSEIETAAEMPIDIDQLTLALDDEISFVDARFTSPSSGPVVIGAPEPVILPFGRTCPIAGMLSIRLSNALDATVSFRSDSSMAIDLASDGTVDEIVADCRN